VIPGPATPFSSRSLAGRVRKRSRFTAGSREISNLIMLFQMLDHQAFVIEPAASPSRRSGQRKMAPEWNVPRPGFADDTARSIAEHHNIDDLFLPQGHGFESAKFRRAARSTGQIIFISCFYRKFAVRLKSCSCAVLHLVDWEKRPPL
jgi:hypothetical protein